MEIFTLIPILNLGLMEFQKLCFYTLLESNLFFNLKETRKLSAARIHSRFGSARDNADGASGAINVT